MSLLHLNDEPGQYPESWYAESTPQLPRMAALEGDVASDICVVGGGYTGLSAALHLARLGFSVRLLEAHRVGFGASGRNGGQVGSGQRLGQPTLEGMLGRDYARRLWMLGEAAKSRVRSLIAEYGIDCDWRDGHASVPIQPRQERALRSDIERMAQRYDYPLEWWDRHACSRNWPANVTWARSTTLPAATCIRWPMRWAWGVRRWRPARGSSRARASPGSSAVHALC